MMEFIIGRLPEFEAKLECDPKLRDWFTEQITFPFDFNGTWTVPRWLAIAVLAFKNGGFRVNGWGFHSGNGPFGQGLSQDEALTMIDWVGFMQGVSMYGENPVAILEPVMKTVWQACADEIASGTS